ncbi:MAG TPA: hypothetical protein VIW29_03425, partial [Polyangiaceae bacterium]
IDGLEHYHQGTDTPQNLDLRSLEHHGQHALAFARHFANQDLDQLSRSTKSSVFFDLFGVVVVTYPYWAARAFALLGLSLVALLWAECKREDALVSGKIVRSALSFVGSLGVLALLLAGLGALITLGWPRWAASTQRAALFAYLASVGVAALCLTLSLQKRRFGARASALGPLLAWACLGVATAALAPGATPVFVWPLIGAALSQLLRRRSPLLRLLLLAPAVLGTTQLCYTLLVVLGGQAVFVAAVYSSFAVGLAAAELEPLAQRARSGLRVWLAASALAALTLAIMGRLATSPATGSSIAYGFDSRSRRGFWLSSDHRLERFTAQFLGDSPVHAQSATFAASTPLFQGPAAAFELPAPQLELVSQATTPQGLREVVIRVQSPRGARAILVWEASGASVVAFRYQSQPPLQLVRFSEELDAKLFRLAAGVGYSNGWTVLLVAVPSEGGILSFETPNTGALELQALDKSEGLPQLPPGVAPRRDSETVGPPGDQIWVTAHPLRVPALPGKPQ